MVEEQPLLGCCRERGGVCVCVCVRTGKEPEGSGMSQSTCSGSRGHLVVRTLPRSQEFSAHSDEGVYNKNLQMLQSCPLSELSLPPQSLQLSLWQTPDKRGGGVKSCTEMSDHEDWQKVMRAGGGWTRDRGQSPPRPV